MQRLKAAVGCITSELSCAGARPQVPTKLSDTRDIHDPETIPPSVSWSHMLCGPDIGSVTPDR